MNLSKLVLDLKPCSKKSAQTLIKSIRAVAVRQMSSDQAKYDFQNLKVTTPSEFVKHVELDRPKRRNALNMATNREISKCFSTLATDPDCRVIVFSGAGKCTSSGIDLGDTEFFQELSVSHEPSRRAFRLKALIKEFQGWYNAIEECNKPVIMAIHNACLGLAMDLVSACDMRVCTKDAFFAIKEVDLGLAADIGVLQRFPKIVKNDSLARELVYTARQFDSKEAKDMGLVSAVYEDKAAMMEACLELASTMAAKSPVALQGSKANIVYARDHGVVKGLEYQTTWQAAMLQSEDIAQAISKVMTKEKAVFSKL